MGKKLDEKLGVYHHVGIPHVEAIANMVRNLHLEEKCKVSKQLQEKRNKVLCKISGCESLVHSLYQKDGCCFKHGDVSKKKLCKVCHKNVRSCRGGLCGPCSKKGGVPTVGFCRCCKVQKPRKIGGRCKQCLA